jgi:GH25 family lysozyme M1 (1,4-beta-N-acetylmuramidase)
LEWGAARGLEGWRVSLLQLLQSRRRAGKAFPRRRPLPPRRRCPPDPDFAKQRAALKLWLSAVEAATGHKPIGYATAGILADYFVGSDLDYPLWVRHTPEDPEPVLSLEWKVLQYDDQHRISGIKTTVDRDLFSGDEAAFSELTRRY